MAVAVPDDLRAFLRGRKRLEYDASECEPGQIKLLPLGTDNKTVLRLPEILPWPPGVCLLA